MTMTNQQQNIFGLVSGLAAGLFIIYYYYDCPKIVVKYPTPDNTKGVTYVGKDGDCYQYTSVEVSCGLF